MPLEIVKSILVTGIGQEGQRIQVTTYNRANHRGEQILNVTVSDLTGIEVRSPLTWRFTIDENDPQNAEQLERIQKIRQGQVDQIRAKWKDEKDPDMLAVLREHLSQPAIFYLQHLGTHPIALTVGMNAILHDQSRDDPLVYDILGAIVDLNLI
jgi:hypothetical protein